MAFIKIIKESFAEGKLERLYKQLGANGDDTVSNILRVHSLKPDTLRAHLGLYKAIMFNNSGLSRAQREMIAVITSDVNQCVYWVKHHGAALLKESSDKRILDKLLIDYKKAGLTDMEIIMLDYTIKLTKESCNVTINDINKLRDIGFTDQDIFDINQVVAYFNYVNRIASGLGVELESIYKE